MQSTLNNISHYVHKTYIITIDRPADNEFNLTFRLATSYMA